MLSLYVMLNIAKAWQIWWHDEGFVKISKLPLENWLNLFYE